MPMSVTSNPEEASLIIQFYRGAGRDGRGRTLADVLGFDDDELERHHDFIQWLFPLRTRSGANPTAPTLTQYDIDRFLADANLRSQLQRASERMLKFYGLTLCTTPGVLVVQKSANWSERSVVWLSLNNHNHLRITRILTSLRELGLPEFGKAFYDALKTIYKSEAQDKITPKSFQFWTNAVS